MTKDYSPFSPGLPVSIEFFVGRLQEINRLREKIDRSVEKGLQIVFLSGERGIGKSSLASFVRSLSEQGQNTLGLHTFMGGVSSLQEMARRIFDRLLKESIGKGWGEKIKEFFGDRIRQVGLFGVTVEFGADEKDLKRMVHDFAPALRNLSEKIRDEKKAIFLILDDINGLASSEDFANWLKSLIDEIATSQSHLPLCLALVGLEDRRQSLIKLQPSLARALDPVEIRPWSETESREFFSQSFAKVSTVVDDDALALLTRYAGGFPVLAHEIGEATFKADTDNRIERSDAVDGIFAAADIVGRKHLEPQVFQAIRSNKYRNILRSAAKEPIRINFSRKDLLRQLGSEEQKVLDNFLTRMKKLEVIQSDPDGGPGDYRFRNFLHYLYFWLEAERAEKARE